MKRENRVRIPPIVISATTKKKLDAWRIQFGVPHGRIVDAMLAHVEHDYKFLLPVSGRRPSLMLGLQPFDGRSLPQPDVKTS